ncbi:hypothetical protein BC629DRAFT_1719424, partial [Irpex lacteus]
MNLQQNCDKKYIKSQGERTWEAPDIRDTLRVYSSDVAMIHCSVTEAYHNWTSRTGIRTVRVLSLAHQTRKNGFQNWDFVGYDLASIAATELLIQKAPHHWHVVYKAHCCVALWRSQRCNKRADPAEHLLTAESDRLHCSTAYYRASHFHRREARHHACLRYSKTPSDCLHAILT